MARVTDNGAASEAFAATNDVKRNCILAPTVLSLMLFTMFMDSFREECLNIIVVYKTDGLFFNIQRIEAPTCHYKTTLHDLFFANYWASNTTTDADMQKSVELFAASFAHLDLAINMDTPMVMHQPMSDNELRIYFNGI
nr:unnamed protein product [Spirometra erinaceieuropaei]